MISIITSAIIEAIIGIIIGTIPGLHSNLLATSLFFRNDLNSMIIIFSSLISSNVFEFVSASYLNTPKEGEVLAKDVLQKFMIENRILTAFKIISYSSIITYSIVLIIGLLIGNIISWISFYFSKYSWIFLIIISIIILAKQKNKNAAIIIFLTSGMFGLISLNFKLNQPFLALLTGMFGLSGFFEKNKSEIPSQMEKTAVESNFFDLFKVCFISCISSIIMMLVPNMSPSQIIFFNSKQKNDEQKIANMASVNIADNALSLISLFFIGKGRSGSVEKIAQMNVFETKEYYLLLICGFLSVMISSILIIRASKIMNKNIDLINSNYLKIFIFIFVCLLCFYFDGLTGLIILAISIILGLFSKKINSRPINLMGCLIIPTILFFIINFF